MAVANTLDYYDMVTITAVKSFTVQALFEYFNEWTAGNLRSWVNVTKLFYL